ncbi:MAG TPA: exonuclease domain-containing protein [Solirubrobacterales bacterium]|nr:exonuclease domain-containing protein [Solirubrobacterales bacterium]
MTATGSPAELAFTEAALPSGSTPWREVDFTVIDLETTGLDPGRDEIISFATVSVRGGRITLADARYELVRPNRMPSSETIRIHGLREADLVDAPPLSALIDDLLEVLTGRALVAHVASVEGGFLDAALSAHGLELRNPMVDTAELDRELRSLRRDPAGKDPIALSEMARDLGLPVHRPHHADGDALTTAQAFIALATHLEAFRPQTLRTLAQFSLHRGRKPLSLRELLHRFVFRHA